MWTNKNTPLLIAAGLAGGLLLTGLLINTAWSISVMGGLALLMLALGIQSRRMTGLWLTDDVRLWQRDIQRFERQDARQMPPQGAIVVVGSSTIKFWKTLAVDMAPLPTIQRGFGGSRLHDAVYYADRIVNRYRPAAVVLFSGTNDMAGALPKSPEYVATQFERFCAVVPDVPIYYVAITPTASRWERWPTVQEANRLIEAVCHPDPRLHFIPTAAAFLGEDGLPMRQLYVWDKLHLSAAGYAVLTGIVKPILMRDFPELGVAPH